MPLGLVPRVLTQGIGWTCQEVHHWGNAFSSTANFVSFNSREREISEKSRGVITVILLRRQVKPNLALSVLSCLARVFVLLLSGAENKLLCPNWCDVHFRTSHLPPPFCPRPCGLERPSRQGRVFWKKCERCIDRSTQRQPCFL